MFQTLKNLTRSVVFASLFMAASSASASGNHTYKVTITNLTNSINLTPILIASHRKNVSIFEAGEAASPEMTAIAEGGDIAPLATLLEHNPRVSDVQNSEGLLAPGKSVSVTVSARQGTRHFSLASMMLPTNDGFIGLSSVIAPKHGSKTYFSPGYDAGTEPNDELCVSIPGPTCGGAGPSPELDGEGYIHINRGIHGIGDLAANVYDWRNPVVKVTIERIQ